MNKKYALIGTNIKNSLSPKIHSRLAEIHGLQSSYELLECNSLNEAKTLLLKKDYHGFNVTMPYKIALMKEVSGIAESAALAAALNTLVLKSGEYEAHNTDGAGFLDALSIAGYDSNNRRVLLYGSGGAARGIASQLLQENIRSLYFESRSSETKIRFYNALNGSNETRLTMMNGVLGLIVDLLVNCTPLGMHETDAAAIDLDTISCEMVFDIVYSKEDTQLVKAAKERGIPAISGIDMLICQAIRSFYIWNPSFAAEGIDAGLFGEVKSYILEG